MRDDIPSGDLWTRFNDPPPEPPRVEDAERSVPSASPSLAFLQWGVAEFRAPNSDRMWDRFIVTSAPGGALVGVIDGLGDGSEADQAAESAAAILESHAGQPIWWLLQRCHLELRDNHEATIALAAISRGGMLKWGGIGNIDGTVVRSSVSSRRAEVAMHLACSARFILPRVQLATTPLTGGDVVILATRGVAPGMAQDVSLIDDPGPIAERILRRHRGHDEAIVLVVRFLGT